MRKTMRRISSSLLALLMLFGSVTSSANLFPLQAAAKAKEGQKKYGYTLVSNGKYAALPEKVTYLGSETAPIIDYDNGGKKFQTNVNSAYNNGNPGGQIQLLDEKASCKGDGASAAWTGGTAFSYGLGVHPCNNKEGYTDIDLTGLQVDTFYSAVGVTNNKTMNSVQFCVYGKADKDADWKVLMDYTTVKKGTSGEIRLDISGYSYLRLAVKQVEKYQSLSSAWANACVYKQYGYFPVSEGKYEKLPQNAIYLGSEAAPITDYDNGGKKFQTNVNSAYNNGNPGGQIQLLDAKASHTGEGEKAVWTGGTAFSYGLGVHPCNNREGYTDIDLTKLQVDTFYSAVGVTNNKTMNSVQFCVYGKTDKNGDWKALMDYTTVKKGTSGEIRLDISDYAYLRLAVKQVEKYQSLSSAWANACVYDSTVQVECVHKLTHVEAKEPTKEQDGNIEHWYCELCGKYFADAQAKTEISASDVILRIKGYTASTDGSYQGFNAEPIYLSALSDKEISSYVTPASDGAPRTVKKDVNWSGNAIKLGEKQQTFKKGLSGVASLPSKAQNYIQVSLDGRDVDRFYAVVGIDGSAAVPGNANYGTYGVVFTVYASKEKTDSTNIKDYEKLESSGVILRRESGEFNVNIAGYKTLLLVCECSSTKNSGCNFAWGNACVYNSKNLHTHTLVEVPEKAAAIGTDGHIRYWMCEVCDKWFYDARGTTEITDRNSVVIPGLGIQATDNYIPNTDGIFARMPSDAIYLTSLKYNSFVTPGSDGKARNAKRDTNWQGGTIVLGQMQSTFVKGLSVLPSAAGKANNYIRADISGQNVNRFYAAVGITGSASNSGSGNYGKYGVTFYVYGSTKKTSSTDVKDYTLLACSGKLYRRDSGQFNVEISGIKTLLLVVETTDGKNYGCDSAWGSVCVYSGDGNLTTAFDAKAYRSNNGVSRGINPRKGTVLFLSDQKYLEAKNNNSAKKLTSLDHPYGSTSQKIILGTKDNRYDKGLGVHPSGYIVYDVSKLGRDTFYASVGITNEKGKNGASAGVIFKVYGDYGDGNYQLLAQSQVITKKMTGEFYVNIKDVKKLRLAVEPNGKVDSSGCAWAAACLYNADPRAAYSTDLTENNPLPKVTEPTAGFQIVEKGFMKMNKSAVWLSDLPYTSYVTPGKDNTARKVTRDMNWNGKTIVFGATQTNFKKGFGVLPSIEKNDDNYIQVDISGQENYRFYSAVGMDGSAAKVGHKNYGQYGTIFLVYGSKEKLTSIKPKDYTLLGSSGAIYGQTVGEFDLDVAGYQTLLLIADSAGELNYGCSGAWGNACLYTPNGLVEPVKDKYFQKDAYVSNVNGFKGIPDEMKKTRFYLSDMQLLGSSNLVTDEYPQGAPTVLDGVYGGTARTGFVLSAKNTKFVKGLGMMGKARNTPVEGSVESVTTYDISSKRCTKFYAAVGLTNEQARDSAQVVFRVFGDYKGRGQFRLLAESETLSGNKTGEFQVDATGVKVLKLVVVSIGESNAGSESAWADACVYGRAAVQEAVQKESNFWYLFIPVGVLVIVAAAVVPFIIRKKRNPSAKKRHKEKSHEIQEK